MNRRGFIVKGAVLAGSLWFPDRARAAEAAHRYKLAPVSILPEQIQKGPAETREAYRFAAANRDVLRYIPCYCGCGETAGHTSNASCYVKDKSPINRPEFDSMSIG